MEKKNWETRLRELDTSLEESFLESSKAVDEHLTAIVRELGAAEMGVNVDAQEALSQAAMALECVHLLRLEAVEIAEELRDRAAEDIRNPDAQAKTADPNARHGDAGIPAPHGKTTSTPEASEVKRLRKLMVVETEKQDLQRSLLSHGELLTEESFLREALEAVEAMLEALPAVSQPHTGAPSLEEEATRAYAGLRAALRSGVRAVVEVDVDDSDNGKLGVAK